MGEPIRHHYLPIAAYLQFFTTDLRSDAVYLYRRGEDTRLVGVRDVGVEKFLYSLETATGQQSQDLETLATAVVDARAVELMKKLNVSSRVVDLSTDDANLLRDFVSLLMVRTPAFRKTLVEFDMALLKKPEDIDLSVREDARLLDAGLSEKQLEEILERAHRDIEKMVGERNYWLIRIGRFLELLDEELRLKRIEILATDDESVITSDHPVARSDNAGVRNSNLFFPIGKRRILAFTDRSAQRMSGPMKIDVKRIPGSLAREINKATIGHAEQFILGSVKRPPIKILFDRTSPPTRMMPNSGVR